MGSLGTHFTLRTFKLTGAAKTKEERYFIQCRTRSYEQRAKESKPKPYQGHTFTWRSSLTNLTSLERGQQQHHWHMVRTKSTPWHAEVRPLKCVVYITRNPVTFVIHRRREFYLLDQQVQEKKHQAEYKWHVHTPPAQCTTTITT